MKKDYISRLADEVLKYRMSIFGAVNVVGPKWCGKSETAKQLSSDMLKVDDFDILTQEQINFSPKTYISDKRPFFVDEWQIAPHIWDVVRNIVDEEKEPGRFILSGSTSTTPITSHSGQGRINTFAMYPMSLYETNESNGKISLNDLFNNKFRGEVKSTLKLEQLIFAACRGGWPWAILTEKGNKQLEVAQSYFEDIYTKDILNIKNPSTKPSIMKKVLQAYGRNISTYAENSVLYNDANIDKDTLTTYLDVLKRLYIVEELEPWDFSLRSKWAIRSQYKREFVDPSIACAAIKATPSKLLNNLETFGFIFECLCIRDLKIYSSSNYGRLYYYKLKTGPECDCLLELKDGRYALIEIKLGAARIKSGIENLVQLEDTIKKYNSEQEDKSKKQPLPTFKMVLTGSTDLAYQDEKTGIYVIPIGCLKD